MSVPLELHISVAQKKKLAKGKSIRIKYGEYGLSSESLHPNHGVAVHVKKARKIVTAFKKKSGFVLDPHDITDVGAGFFDAIKSVIGKVIPHIGDIANVAKQGFDIYNKVKGGNTGRGVYDGGNTGRGVDDDEKGGFPFLPLLGALPSIISAGKSLFGLGVGKRGKRTTAKRTTGRRAPNLRRDAKGRFLPRSAGHV